MPYKSLNNMYQLQQNILFLDFDITVWFGYYIDRNKLKEGREKLEKVRMKEGRKSE